MWTTFSDSVTTSGWGSLVFWDVTFVAVEQVSTFSNDRSLFFFSFKRSYRMSIFCTAWPWRWRRYSPPQRRELLAQRHDVTFRKHTIMRSSILALTAVIKWNSGVLLCGRVIAVYCVSHGNGGDLKPVSGQVLYKMGWRARINMSFC